MAGLIIASLDEATLAQAACLLADLDPDLAGIYARLGPPPLWAREEGFPTLLYIILEQQVSLASARAAYQRLLAAATPLTPESFLQMDDLELKSIGFSRQKTGYGRNLARAILQGELDLAALGWLDDSEVRSQLLKIKGIGPWTANIYLLMALLRPDIWPRQDLALAVAVQRVKRLASRPSLDEMEALSQGWRPWRAVAARMLWQDYLSSNGRRIT
ncbi:MAG: DNA-3-methyladenine glycosylase 2 family protein [Anaerolineales bacterium]|nr:DNA-3-methyladenine glycosylase 2 family protein [Anaerolineales bacterium]